jgi:hypothetical protein
MSVHAGSILTVGGNNVIDRIQSAGAAGDVPIETIREVGNRLVVDKIPGEPDFTFTIESLDVSTELMAWLTGKIGGSLTDPTGFPGAADAAGTGYRWSDTGYVNVTSPWKDPLTLDQGIVQAGHIIPAYYPTRINYRFGVADNAGTTVELGGGSYYYGSYAPIEEFAQTDGVEDSWTTSENAIAHRIGGGAGTTFRSVFGVVVGGVAQIEGVDYSVGGGDGAPATVTFMVNGVATPPATGKLVRFCYFTDAAPAAPVSGSPPRRHSSSKPRWTPRSSARWAPRSRPAASSTAATATARSPCAPRTPRPSWPCWPRSRAPRSTRSSATST